MVGGFPVETVHVIILSCLQDFICAVSVAVDNAGQRILERKRLGEEKSGMFWWFSNLSRCENYYNFDLEVII